MKAQAATMWNIQAELLSCIPTSKTCKCAHACVTIKQPWAYSSNAWLRCLKSMWKLWTHSFLSLFPSVIANLGPLKTFPVFPLSRRRRISPFNAPLCSPHGASPTHTGQQGVGVTAYTKLLRLLIVSSDQDTWILEAATARIKYWTMNGRVRVSKAPPLVININ